MGSSKLKMNSNKNYRQMLQGDRKKLCNITVKDFFETHKKFMQDKALEGLREITLNGHTEHMRYFQSYLEKAYQSDINYIADKELDFTIFKDYIRYMSIEKQYSNYTVNVRLRTLKCYLTWLYENKYLSENLSIKLKLQKVAEDTIQPLTTQEVKKMLKACDVNTYNGFRDYTTILLMLDCGIRVGELVELTINDVDLQNNIITLGGEKAKTGRVRYMPISKQVSKLLKELIDIAKENDCEYVFQSIYGGKIKKQNLILAFRRLGARVGLEKRCTPHVFRHTFALNAIKAGMDVFTLQRIMGHSTLLTTRKYIQLQQEDLINHHNKANMIDKYLPEGGKR